jgi:hypothetical protein
MIMRRPGNLSGWSFGSNYLSDAGFGFLRPENSPLFQADVLKSPEEELTSTDLWKHYGPMTEMQERSYRQQSQVMGRPLTRAEQQALVR